MAWRCAKIRPEDFFDYALMKTSTRSAGRSIGQEKWPSTFPSGRATKNKRGPFSGLDKYIDPIGGPRVVHTARGLNIDAVGGDAVVDQHLADG